MKRIIYFLLFNFLFSFSLTAQCFDADANIWLDTWASCEESPNPKSEYGNTHWIQYDFGSVRPLSKTWAWNANDPAKLTQGFNLVKIDYSTDGQAWEHWGEMNFPKGTGEPVYGGFPGPDMVGIEAQYVLLTAISNHGDANCAGIAEIKFNLMSGDTLGIPPGGGGGDDCAGIEEIIIEEITETEAFIFWEVDGEIEDLFFVFEFRIAGGDWEEIITDEPEVFLEDLEPATEYEFRISFECGEEITNSAINSFTTLKGELCAAVEDIWLEEIFETEVLVVWEEAGPGDFYIVQFGPAGSNDLEEDETEEPEIFLGDLEPNTEYIIIVGIECGDEILWSEPFMFFTENDFPSPVSSTFNKLYYGLYPNPTSGQINLEYSSQYRDMIEYTITDVMGKKIKSNNAILFPGTNNIILDISNLPEGVYLLNTYSQKGQRRVSERIVKIN
ncbi:MAG: T9SS type A sorting domain-containing protein [Bacteroidota bacterium]